MVLYLNIFCFQTTRQVTDHAVVLRSLYSLGLDSGSLVPIAFIGCSVESGSNESWGCVCLQTRLFLDCIAVVCTVLLVYPGCSNDSAVSASLSSKVSTPIQLWCMHM